MELKMTKVSETKVSTVSKLEINGQFICFILEDGHRDIKEYGETRIPAGRYQIIQRYAGRHFEKYKDRFDHEWSLYIPDVPNFKWIMLHIGNTIKDTEGCLLTGNMVGYIPEDDTFKVYYSTKAYLRLYALLKKAFDEKLQIWLTIKR